MAKRKAGTTKRRGGTGKNTRHMPGGDRKGPKKPRTY